VTRLLSALEPFGGTTDTFDAFSTLLDRHKVALVPQGALPRTA
jgi:hypothetical protein